MALANWDEEALRRDAGGLRGDPLIPLRDKCRRRGGVREGCHISAALRRQVNRLYCPHSQHTLRAESLIAKFGALVYALQWNHNSPPRLVSSIGGRRLVWMQPSPSALSDPAFKVCAGSTRAAADNPRSNPSRASTGTGLRPRPYIFAGCGRRADFQRCDAYHPGRTWAD